MSMTLHPSERAMPASPEAEQHVIAACLIDEGITLDRAIGEGVTEDCFLSPANRLLFATLAGLRKENKPIDLSVLAQELKSKRLLDSVDGMAYLLEVTRTVETTTKASYFINELKAKHQLRELIRLGTGTIERAYNATNGDAGHLLEDLEREVGVLSEKKTDGASLLKSRRVTIAKKPSEPVTRLFLAGKPIATPGNIQTLIAKAKQGKTATTGGAVAAIIASHHDRHGMDTLGFTAPHTNEAVVVLDTEQSLYDTWTCQQRILARAGEQEDPEWLCHYALVGLSVQDKKTLLIAALKAAKQTHGGVFLVILDGVAHFVRSVNDEIECNEVAVWIRALSIEYDCPIMCIIHSNEGVKSGDDGRGHLGKQLTRDAESNLLLKKDGDITTITSEKQRKAPITEQDGIAFRWSDELGRHVSCVIEQSNGGAKRIGRKPIYSLSQFIEFFPKHPNKHAPLPVLWNKCRSIADIPRNTFRDLCEREYGCGELARVIDQNLGPCYRLMPAPQ